MKSSVKRVLLPSFAEMMEGNGLEPVEFPGETDEAPAFAEAEVPEPEAPEEPEKTLEEIERERVEELCAGMRREAISQANAIVAQAKEEAAAIRGKAMRDMDEEIEKRTHAALLPLRGAAEAAAAALQEARSALYETLEPYFLETALAIARNILRRELDKDDRAYLDIVRNVLSQNYLMQDLVLHIPPQQFERLMEAEGGAFKEDMERQGVKVVSDKGIGDTDCMVTSSMGSIRGGVEVQLSRIRYAADNQQSEA